MSGGRVARTDEETIPRTDGETVKERSHKHLIFYKGHESDRRKTRVDMTEDRRTETRSIESKGPEVKEVDILISTHS